MRERHVLRDDVAVNLRITPARAGKTRPACHRHERRQDHPRSCGKDVPSHSTSRPQDGSPRSCGKDIFQLYWISLNLGSPPLVRERPYVTDNLSVHTGITPARAGKTWVFCYGVWVKWDHPRSCGKDTFMLPMRSQSMWITPARAGKTVMDSFIFALLRLLTFKIYSTSLPNI